MKLNLRTFLADPLGLGVTIGIVLALLMTAVASITSATSTGAVSDCQVVKKTLLGSEKGRHSGRIEAVGCNGSSERKTFDVANNDLAGYLNSDEVFSQLEVGKTYTFKVLGVSFPPVMSQNIAGIK